MKRRTMLATIRLLAGFGLVFALVAIPFAQRGFAQEEYDAAPTPPVSGKLPPNAAPPPRVGPGGPAGPAGPGTAPVPAGPHVEVFDGIHLSPITPIASSVHVHSKVLEECRLQTILPQAIAERNSDVVLSDAKGAVRLELRIIDIHAPSGGFLSGPKWVTVDGKLMQGKTVKGTFLAKQTSMASATACGMLNKVIMVLGGDIAQWLHNPSTDARLGSAR